eukprot:5220633-Pleurochrysis_carterae.AAC.1
MVCPSRRPVVSGGGDASCRGRHQVHHESHGRFPGAQAGHRLCRAARGVRLRKAANVAPTRNVARDVLEG